MTNHEPKHPPADMAGLDGLIERLRERLGSVSSPMMKGDNLAILLCSFFDNPDQEPGDDDDCGWTEDALKGYEEVCNAIHAHYATQLQALAQRVKVLEAENERLRGMLNPQWFYAGEDQSSDQCRFSIDEVLEEELYGWGPPKTGKRVVHVSTALPGPDIWVAVHVFTDEEKDERGDDEIWSFEEFSTEAEARAALKGTEG